MSVWVRQSWDKVNTFLSTLADFFQQPAHTHVFGREGCGLQFFKSYRGVTGGVRTRVILATLTRSENLLLSSPGFKKATSKVRHIKMPACLENGNCVVESENFYDQFCLSLLTETECQTTASSGHKPAKDAKKEQQYWLQSWREAWYNRKPDKLNV